MSLFDLTGKVALVTGATKGIGRGIVERMAEHGAKIVVSSRDQAACEQTAAELNDTYGKDGDIAIGIAADIEDLDALQSLVDRSLEKFGRIDTLVCNAAILPMMGPSVDTPIDHFERILNGNIHLTFRLCQMVIPQMKERHDGSIILIGSGAGLSASPNTMAYGLSKAGQAHLALSLASEVAPFNIRVNCVAPGLTRSFSSGPIWKNEDILKAATTGNPLQRIGEPDDIAGGVIFLASAAGCFVTGETIPIDGGGTRLPPHSEKDALGGAFEEGHQFN